MVKTATVKVRLFHSIVKKAPTKIEKKIHVKTKISLRIELTAQEICITLQASTEKNTSNILHL